MTMGPMLNLILVLIFLDQVNCSVENNFHYEFPEIREIKEEKLSVAITHPFRDMLRSLQDLGVSTLKFPSKSRYFWHTRVKRHSSQTVDLQSPEKTYDGKLHIVEGIHWREDLNHRNTTSYAALELFMLSFLDDIFDQSPLSQKYQEAVIKSFSPGSVLVEFSIIISENNTNDEANTTSQNAGEDMDALFMDALQNISSSNNFTVDLNSSGIVESPSNTMDDISTSKNFLDQTISLQSAVSTSFTDSTTVETKLSSGVELANAYASTEIPETSSDSVDHLTVTAEKEESTTHMTSSERMTESSPNYSSSSLKDATSEDPMLQTTTLTHEFTITKDTNELKTTNIETSSTATILNIASGSSMSTNDQQTSQNMGTVSTDSEISSKAPFDDISSDTTKSHQFFSTSEIPFSSLSSSEKTTTGTVSSQTSFDDTQTSTSIQTTGSNILSTISTTSSNLKDTSTKSSIAITSMLPISITTYTQGLTNVYDKNTITSLDSNASIYTDTAVHEESITTLKEQEAHTTGFPSTSKNNFTSSSKDVTESMSSVQSSLESVTTTTSISKAESSTDSVQNEPTITYESNSTQDIISMPQTSIPNDLVDHLTSETNLQSTTKSTTNYQSTQSDLNILSTHKSATTEQLRSSTDVSSDTTVKNGISIPNTSSLLPTYSNQTTTSITGGLPSTISDVESGTHSAPKELTTIESENSYVVNSFQTTENSPKTTSADQLPNTEQSTESTKSIKSTFEPVSASSSTETSTVNKQETSSAVLSNTKVQTSALTLSESFSFSNPENEQSTLVSTTSENLSIKETSYQTIRTTNENDIEQSLTTSATKPSILSSTENSSEGQTTLSVEIKSTSTEVVTDLASTEDNLESGSSTDSWSEAAWSSSPSIETTDFRENLQTSAKMMSESETSLYPLTRMSTTANIVSNTSSNVPKTSSTREMTSSTAPSSPTTDTSENQLHTTEVMSEKFNGTTKTSLDLSTEMTFSTDTVSNILSDTTSSIMGNTEIISNSNEHSTEKTGTSQNLHHTTKLTLTNSDGTLKTGIDSSTKMSTFTEIVSEISSGTTTGSFTIGNTGELTISGISLADTTDTSKNLHITTESMSKNSEGTLGTSLDSSPQKSTETPFTRKSSTRENTQEMTGIAIPSLETTVMSKNQLHTTEISENFDSDGTSVTSSDQSTEMHFTTDIMTKISSVKITTSSTVGNSEELKGRNGFSTEITETSEKQLHTTNTMSEKSESTSVAIFDLSTEMSNSTKTESKSSTPIAISTGENKVQITGRTIPPTETINVSENQLHTTEVMSENSDGTPTLSSTIENTRQVNYGDTSLSTFDLSTEMTLTTNKDSKILSSTCTASSTKDITVKTTGSTTSSNEIISVSDNVQHSTKLMSGNPAGTSRTTSVSLTQMSTTSDTVSKMSSGTPTTSTTRENTRQVNYGDTSLSTLDLSTKMSLTTNKDSKLSSSTSTSSSTKDITVKTTGITTPSNEIISVSDNLQHSTKLVLGNSAGLSDTTLVLSTQMSTTSENVLKISSGIPTTEVMSENSDGNPTSSSTRENTRQVNYDDTSLSSLDLSTEMSLTTNKDSKILISTSTASSTKDITVKTTGSTTPSNEIISVSDNVQHSTKLMSENPAGTSHTTLVSLTQMSTTSDTVSKMSSGTPTSSTTRESTRQMNSDDTSLSSLDLSTEMSLNTNKDSKILISTSTASSTKDITVKTTGSTTPSNEIISVSDNVQHSTKLMSENPAGTSHTTLVSLSQMSTTSDTVSKMSSGTPTSSTTRESTRQMNSDDTSLSTLALSTEMSLNTNKDSKLSSSTSTASSTKDITVKTTGSTTPSNEIISVSDNLQHSTKLMSGNAAGTSDTTFVLSTQMSTTTDTVSKISSGTPISSSSRENTGEINGSYILSTETTDTSANLQQNTKMMSENTDSTSEKISITTNIVSKIPSGSSTTSSTWENTREMTSSSESMSKMSETTSKAPTSNILGTNTESMAFTIVSVNSNDVATTETVRTTKGPTLTDTNISDMLSIVPITGRSTITNKIPETSTSMLAEKELDVFSHQNTREVTDQYTFTYTISENLETKGTQILSEFTSEVAAKETTSLMVHVNQPVTTIMLSEMSSYTSTTENTGTILQTNINHLSTNSILTEIPSVVSTQESKGTSDDQIFSTKKSETSTSLSTTDITKTNIDQSLTTSIPVGINDVSTAKSNEISSSTSRVTEPALSVTTDTSFYATADMQSHVSISTSAKTKMSTSTIEHLSETSSGFSSDLLPKSTMEADITEPMTSTISQSANHATTKIFEQSSTDTASSILNSITTQTIAQIGSQHMTTGLESETSANSLIWEMTESFTGQTPNENRVFDISSPVSTTQSIKTSTNPSMTKDMISRTVSSTFSTSSQTRPSHLISTNYDSHISSNGHSSEMITQTSMTSKTLNISETVITESVESTMATKTNHPETTNMPLDTLEDLQTGLSTETGQSTDPSTIKNVSNISGDIFTKNTVKIVTNTASTYLNDVTIGTTAGEKSDQKMTTFKESTIAYSSTTKEIEGTSEMTSTVGVLEGTFSLPFKDTSATSKFYSTTSLPKASNLANYNHTYYSGETTSPTTTVVTLAPTNFQENVLSTRTTTYQEGVDIHSGLVTTTAIAEATIRLEDKPTLLLTTYGVMKTTTPKPIEAKTYEGQISTDKTWSEDLNDPNSDAYKEAYEEFMAFLVLICRQMGIPVSSIVIKGFRPGSVMIDFHLVFNGMEFENEFLKDSFNLAYEAILDPKITMKKDVTNFDVSLKHEDSGPLNICDYNPCHGNSVCVTVNSTFECRCPFGFYYDDNCRDVNECLVDPCPSDSLCSNGYGSFFCTCKSGYKTLPNGTCLDINECTLSPCGPHSDCVNSPGSYYCKCHSGYEWNGDSCQDSDECKDYPCLSNALCTNTIGSYNCTCSPGFTMVNSSCVDINECEQTDACPQLAECVNYEGGYRCTCYPGYYLKDGDCYDEDECDANVCPANAQCINTNGSYTCVCNMGFTQVTGICEDLNECLGQPCGNYSICVNTFGNYSCLCKSGFADGNNGCQDINECQDQDLCHNNSVCINTVGSFSCPCLSGYAGYSGQCEDVDECLYDVCDTNSVCVNTPGSYHCQCLSGYTLINSKCEDLDECRSSPCQSNAYCTNSEGSYSCTCLLGYIMAGNQCIDIDECSSPGKCPSNSDCNNIEGGYTCLCHPGFYQTGPFTCTESILFKTKVKIIQINNTRAEFSSSLYDNSSTVFKSTALQFEHSIDQILSKVEIGLYLGTKVTQFYPGSIVVESYSYFAMDTSMTTSNLATALADSTDEFYNYSLDINETSIEVELINKCNLTDMNSCSEFSFCIPGNGTYTCDCFSEYIDISVNKDGTLCAVIDEINQDPILTPSITTNHTFYAVNDTVTFYVSITRGSHVTFFVNYGDGHTLQQTPPEDLTFQFVHVFTHRFDKPSTYTINLTATNKVSTMKASTNIVIQRKLQNLILNLTETTPESYQGNVMLTVYPAINETYMDLLIEGNFGDSSKFSETGREVSKKNPLKYQHSYNPGVFNFQVIISNKVSSLKILKTLMFHEKIQGLVVTASKYFIPAGEDIYLFIKTMAGSNITFELDYGNETLKHPESIKQVNMKKGPTSLVKTCTFTLPGIYDITVKATNPISQMTTHLSQLIIAQIPVSDLTFYTDPIIAVPPGSINVYITYYGGVEFPSNVTCVIAVHNTETYIFHLGDMSQESFTNVISWERTDLVGQIQLSANCSNYISSLLLNTWVLFQRSLETVTITVSDQNVPVDSTVNFNFTVGVGSHASYEISIANERTVLGSLGQGLFYTEVISLSHTFKTSGEFPVRITVSNAISSIQALENIRVLIPVEGLKFIRYYIISDITNEEHYGHGLSGDIFPLERDLALTSTVVSGNLLTYIWTFGDQQVTTDSNTVQHRFKYPGIFLIQINASNPLYYEAKSTTVEIQQTVLMYSIKNNGPTKAYLFMTFDLKLSRPGTKSCYVWDMGDKSQKTIFGEYHCQDIARKSSMFYRYWIPQSSIQHKHMYRENGTFVVTVTGFNDVSEQKIQDLAILSGISCFYPSVHVVGGGQEIDQPVEYLRSDTITLQSTATVNCEASKLVSYNWKVYKIVQGRTYMDYIFTDYPVDAIATDNFNIQFPPSTFLEGHYKISSNVSMTDITGLSSEHFTYIYVLKTPLNAKVVGGSLRAAGYNTILDVDGWSLSFDPDIPGPDKTGGLQFEWWCRKKGEVIKDYGKTILIPDVDDAVNLTSVGGCFGTGVGKISSNMSVLKFNTLLFMPGSENVFRLRVSKDTRESFFEQNVVIKNGLPRTISVLCLENCKSKMNPSGVFVLKAVCLDCILWDRKGFLWSLSIKNTSTNIYEDINNLNETTQTGIQESVLIFNEKTLIGGKDYRLRVDVKVKGYTDSFSVYEFHTNLPPYGGNCSIEPSSGIALSTKFVISCQGWINPGEEDKKGAGLLYRFWSRPRGSFDTQLLYYGTDPYTPESQFALGPAEKAFMHDISVRISNPIGEYQETWLDIQVKAPPQEEKVENLISLATGSGNLLDTMLASGRNQEAKQVIVALASLINESPSEDVGIARQSLIKDLSSTPTTVKTTTISTTKPTTKSTTTKLFSNETLEYPEPHTTDTAVTSTVILSTTSLITTTTTKATTTSTMSPEQLEETRQQRIKLRTAVLTTLEKQTDSLTIDSLQQTAMCFRVITHETTELSDQAQEITVNAVSKMVESLDTMVKTSSSDSKVQEFGTAEEILSCLGNIVLASTEMSLEEILAEGTDESEEVLTTPVTTTSLVPSVNSTATMQAPVTSQTKSKAEVMVQKVKDMAKRVLSAADRMYQIVIQTRTPGEPPVVLESRHLTLVASSQEVQAFGQETVTVPSGSFGIPSADKILGDNSSTTFVNSKFLSSQRNPFMWDISANHIKTSVMTLNLYSDDNQDIKVRDIEEDFKIEVKVSESARSNVRHTVLTNKDTSLKEFVLPVPTNNTSGHVVLMSQDANATLLVYVRLGTSPTTEVYDMKMTIPKEVTEEMEAELDAEMVEEYRHMLFLSPEFVSEHGVGDYIIGVTLQESNSSTPNYDDYYTEYIDPDANTVYINTSIYYWRSGCFFWNESQESWQTYGCKVSPYSNSQRTLCLCNHLTSFGADFYVAPNPINFNTVFTNMASKVRDNWAVLATLCFIFGLYIAATIWARHMDKKDVQKWGVAPLVDNCITDSYYYQLSIYTGMRKSAGTKSQISFILAGDHCDTGVRLLADEKGIKECSRGSVNVYVLSTQEWLGPLSYLRVWHDNSGSGKYQGWYFSKAVVTDLQTGDNCYFLCNRWLAVEEDDGMIDRVVPVAGREDLTTFQTLFVSSSKRKLTDSHLWISVFSRPHRSNFSRVQRLSCILSLLMTTMMANAMFYQTEQNVERKEVFIMGPFEISLFSVYVSFVSSLIVLPVNVLIDMIFRKSKQCKNKIGNAFLGNVKPITTLSNVKLQPWNAKLKDVKDNTVLSDVTEEEEFEKSQLHLSKSNFEASTTSIGAFSVRSDASLIQSNPLEVSHPNSAAPSSKKKRIKKKSLPHGCVYVAWCLVFLSSTVSAFITFLYSMEWGKEKSLSWLASILLSIFESITVIQPFKIVIIAVIIAALLKKPEEEEEDTDDEERNWEMHPKNDEELLFNHPRKVKRPDIKIDAIDVEKLAVARKIRLQEMKMHAIIREIVFYFLFLALVLLVASHNRDSKTYHMKEAMLQIISPGNQLAMIHTINDLYNWTENVLLSNAYVINLWNMEPPGANEERMISNMAAFRVGPIRIRQLRVQKVKCLLSPVLYSVMDWCSEDWTNSLMEDQDFAEDWESNNSSFVSKTQKWNNPWKYRSFFKNGAIPFAGTHGVYPGGGYVLDLIGNRQRALNLLLDIKNSTWLDRYTRAVFVSFTVYNPNANFFSTVVVNFELPTIGEIVTTPVIKVFRLFSYLGGYGIFVVFIEVLTLFSTLYYLFRELRKIRKEGKPYFKLFWNKFELFTLLSTIVSIAMYIVRHVITASALSNVTKLRDKFYNFEKVALWDEIFGYVLGFTIFASIIKIINMFKFNRKMSMIAGTLRNSTKELSAFSVVFVVFLLGFAVWGYIMFGSNVSSYCSMIQAIETLVAFSLGDYDYNTLATSNRVFGPIYFFSFFFAINFLLLNIFVTILNESIATVKKDVSKQSNEYEIVAFMWSRFVKWVGLDLDKILMDVRQKYMVEKVEPPKQSVENDLNAIILKLDTVMRKLDTYDPSAIHPYDPTLNDYAQPYPTPIFFKSRHGSPLFTRLFPTLYQWKLPLKPWSEDVYNEQSSI